MKNYPFQMSQKISYEFVQFAQYVEICQKKNKTPQIQAPLNFVAFFDNFVALIR